jgi:hypothetical protein
MVVAQAKWLPQYAGAIAGAKQRLGRATVKTRDWVGAAPKTRPPVWQATSTDGERLLRKGAA